MGSRIDIGDWDKEWLTIAAAPRGHDPQADAIEAFKGLLHSCCSISDDRQFWVQMEAGIRAMEQTMAPERVNGFEYAIDSILVQHGLTAWSLVRPGSG